MVRFDLMLENNDIVIQNNDFVLAESDEQHVIDTINACPGWWKQFYSDGISIISYLKARNIEQLLSKNIKLQLKSDGYTCSPIVGYVNNTLSVNPNVTV